MNIENIDKAIAVMERAKARDSVDMRAWQTTHNARVAASIEAEFHSCGNKGCFAGHIAVSHEWQNDGGRIGLSGAPWLIHSFGVSASIADWLKVPKVIMEAFIYDEFSDDEGIHRLYGKPFVEVNADDILKALHSLKDLGPWPFAAKYGIDLNSTME